MNWPHVHVMLNHIPIIGIGFVFLLLVAAWRMRSRDVQLVALGACFLVALAAVPVFLTGEPAEETVRDMPNVASGLIHAHEEAAEGAFIAVLIAGAIAGLGLGLRWKRGAVPKGLWVVLTLVVLATNALMIRAAERGGKIQHVEFRGGPTPMGVQELEPGDGR